MKTLIVVITLANGADYASTEYALSRPLIARSDGTILQLAEGNGLMRHASARVGLKAGAVVGQVLWITHLRESGHPRAAAVLTWTVVGLNGALAVHNLRAIRRFERLRGEP